MIAWAWVHRAYQCYCARLNIVVCMCVCESISAVCDTPWWFVFLHSHRRIAIHTVFITHSLAPDHPPPATSPVRSFSCLLAFSRCICLGLAFTQAPAVVDNQRESEKEDRVKIERKQRCPVTVTGSDLHSFLFLFLFGCYCCCFCCCCCRSFHCSLHTISADFSNILPSLHFGQAFRKCLCLH